MLRGRSPGPANILEVPPLGGPTRPVGQGRLFGRNSAPAYRTREAPPPRVTIATSNASRTRCGTSSSSAAASQESRRRSKRPSEGRRWRLSSVKTSRLKRAADRRSSFTEGCATSSSAFSLAAEGAPWMTAGSGSEKRADNSVLYARHLTLGLQRIGRDSPKSAALSTELRAHVCAQREHITRSRTSTTLKEQNNARTTLRIVARRRHGSQRRQLHPTSCDHGIHARRSTLGLAHCALLHAGGPATRSQHIWERRRPCRRPSAVRALSSVVGRARSGKRRSAAAQR